VGLVEEVDAERGAAADVRLRARRETGAGDQLVAHAVDERLI